MYAFKSAQEANRIYTTDNNNLPWPHGIRDTIASRADGEISSTHLLQEHSNPLPHILTPSILNKYERRVDESSKVPKSRWTAMMPVSIGFSQPAMSPKYQSFHHASYLVSREQLKRKLRVCSQCMIARMVPVLQYHSA